MNWLLNVMTFSNCKSYKIINDDVTNCSSNLLKLQQECQATSIIILSQVVWQIIIQKLIKMTFSNIYVISTQWIQWPWFNWEWSLKLATIICSLLNDNFVSEIFHSHAANESFIIWWHQKPRIIHHLKSANLAAVQFKKITRNEWFNPLS